MSPLPVKMMHKKEVVLNLIAEFLGIWAVRGEASLSLTTKDGVTTITFTHSLSGHPEDPLHPPPAVAVAVGQPRESGIVNGLPVIRLPSTLLLMSHPNRGFWPLNG